MVTTSAVLNFGGDNISSTELTVTKADVGGDNVSCPQLTSDKG